MAQAEIVIADEHLLPQVVEIYNTSFRPRTDSGYFTRRFSARHNVLTLLARIDEKPAGFWIGFELKPGVFYHWLGAVVPDFRRSGVASQMQEALESWCREQEYEFIRCECRNSQREFIHFAVSHGYAIVGIRWDSVRSDNLIIFEKSLHE